MGRTCVGQGAFPRDAVDFMLDAGDFMTGLVSSCAVWDDLALIKPVTDPVSGCARRNQMPESFTQDLIGTFQVKIGYKCLW